MPSAAAWMGLEIITLSEESQKKNDVYHTYVWPVKYDMNERVQETETDSQTQKTDLRLSRGRGWGGAGGGTDWGSETSRGRVL